MERWLRGQEHFAALPVPEEAAHNQLQHQLQGIHAAWPITVSSMYTHTHK